MTITAIRTPYDGHEFRSRLEARWAVFFNHLSIRWQFEPEGYRVPDGRGSYREYLADYYLPDLDAFAEVRRSGGADWTLWGRFASAVGIPMLVLGDLPKDADAENGWAHPVVYDVGRVQAFTWTSDGQWNPYGADDSWPNPPVEGAGLAPRHGRPLLPKVAEAYRAALRAKFEHGETPPGRSDDDDCYGPTVSVPINTRILQFIDLCPGKSKSAVKVGVGGSGQKTWAGQKTWDALNDLIDDGRVIVHEGRCYLP